MINRQNELFFTAIASILRHHNIDLYKVSQPDTIKTAFNHYTCCMETELSDQLFTDEGLTILWKASGDQSQSSGYNKDSL